MLKESWRHLAIMIHLMWFLQVQTAVNSSFYCSDKKCCDLLEFILHIVPTHHRRVERKKKFSYNSCFVLTERGRWLKHKTFSTGARKLLWDPIRGCPRNMWSFTTTPSRGSQRGLLMGERWFWWCRGWVCFKHVAWTLSEPPRPPRHCMGVISQCSERWREGVYVAGVQLYAVVLNEAMSEHGENMRVLATSKTPAVFWLCFPVVPRLMAAVATAANKQSEVKRLFNFEKTFISWIMPLFQTLLRLGLGFGPDSLKEQEKILTNVSDKVVLYSHYWVRET